MNKLSYLLPALVVLVIIAAIVKFVFKVWGNPKLTRNDTKHLSILYALALIPSVFTAMMSVTIFDAPGSEDVLNNQLSFLSIVILPFSLLIGFVSGLMKEPKRVLVLLPFFNFFIIAVPKIVYFLRWWVAL